MTPETQNPCKRRRPRFDGLDEDLEAALCISTPRDVIYSEDMNSEINVKLIMAQEHRLRKLVQLQDNLCFRGSQLAAVLKGIGNKHKESWRYDDELVQEFATVVAKRLGAIFRHVSQARGRRTPPAWCRNMFGDSAKKDAQQFDLSEGCATTVDTLGQALFYGYSRELKQAWRRETKDGEKVYSIEVKPNPAGPLFPAIAVWEDGSQHEVSEVLSLSAEASEDVEKQAQGSFHVYFEDSYNGNQLVVKRRSEGPYRPALVSLYLGGQQICQTRISDKLPEEEGAEILSTLGRDLVSGKVQVDGLYEARDKELKKRNVQKRVRKKPATGCSRPPR